jgi:two-component system, OmpR family, heavy metal sensor histidine kinase CusS
MLERLQFDFQRLTEFSSDLAHELRTPISNMLTETQVELSRPRTVEQYQETLASNSEELQRLARTVSDMLYLATTEHGLALPHPEQIRVQDEIHALFDFYDALADEANISMSISGEGLIHGDRLMVRRALNNLLSNALRHTPAHGTILVEVDTTADATSVHVTNTGPAIDPDVLPRLFDRFYRADSARVHPESIGAGLGLPITRAIMRAHGGDAVATSQRNGIQFTLRFPARSGSS